MATQRPVHIDSTSGNVRELVSGDKLGGVTNGTATGEVLTFDAIGASVQSYDADLAAVAGLSSSGLIARTGAGTAASRTTTGTANQVTVTNGDGASGNPTLSLPQDIATTSSPTFGGAFVSNNQNAETQLSVANTTNGTVAQASVKMSSQNASGAYAGKMTAYSSSYSAATLGADVPGNCTFITEGLGTPGLKFAVRNASGTIGFYTNAGSAGIGAAKLGLLVDASQNVSVRAGTDTARAKVGGTIRSDTTAVGNVGAGEDTLNTWTIPASTLAVNGESLEIEKAFSFAANANNKQLKIKFGATTIYASGAVAQNGGSAIFNIRIVRTSATTQDVYISSQLSASSLLPLPTPYQTTAETLSGTIVLLDTGEATANNDVVARCHVTKWITAA